MTTHPLSLALSLFFVINVLGNIPLYMGLLGRYSPKKQRMILIREYTIALVILLAFNFFGARIFEFLGITNHILGMAGGILLLLISITMIFPSHEAEKGPQHEPMIVPLATPVIAGPGSITAVMLFSSRTENPLMMTGVIVGAMVVSCLIALCSSFFKKGLGEKGLVAFERLGGMIVALIAVQMFATGTIALVKSSFGL
ncbi:MAG: NAAT family transporter [Chlamydiia bacterium]|nr:NAAT family transporter [Chlamydiia bacterium]